MGAGPVAMGQGPSGAAPLWAQSQARTPYIPRGNVSGCEHERGPASPDLVVGSKYARPSGAGLGG
jgi:hypothetical protein